MGVAAEEEVDGNRVLTVKLNPRYAQPGNMARMTLLHEMCHLALWGSYKGHGKPFQEEMLRLAKAGAFARLW